MRPISVLFTVPEAELPRSRGPAARQAASGAGVGPGRDGAPREGRLQTIDNQIDTATGSIKLRAQFDNEREQLFPNQFVNVRLRVTPSRGPR